MLETFTRPSHKKRLIFFLLVDVLLLSVSFYLSFLVRFEFNIPAEYKKFMIYTLPLFVTVKLFAFALFGVYRLTWRYVGINDLFNMLSALVLSEILLFILLIFRFPLDFYSLMGIYSYPGFPRSVFFIDFAISTLTVSGVRISKRVYLEILRKRGPVKKGLRTVIIGAGNTGEMILRDMIRQKFFPFYPVGFLDDNRTLLGSSIHGVKVLGTTDQIKSIVEKHNIEAAIIAIPSLNYKAIKSIYESLRESGVKTIKIVPRIYDFHKPQINVRDLEDISIEDLIGRQAVRVDHEDIGNFLRDKVVLITGGGGSIGSEIAMQVCGFYPKKLVLLDIDETALHNISLRLSKNFPDVFEKVHFVVGDIKDQKRVEDVFAFFKPQIVFHAAAYKHVPMMEYNPSEAVKVNIFGTYNVAKSAIKYGTEKFIMISTDKAIRPTSVMGATKRVAEYICRALNGTNGTQFVSVRFGNVLGSRGSVLPIFLEQIKHGGPVTVTHKDMKRYFMTIPEAVSLVLQASVIGKGGDVLVLDMGEPVRILDLAEELIRLHGMEPYKDIPIEFIGLRPGEKLFEEILSAEEGVDVTKHEKIFIARIGEKYSLEEIENILKEFQKALEDLSLQEESKIKELLKKYVKHLDTEHLKASGN